MSSHPPWNHRIQLTFCPHKSSLCDTPGMLKLFFFTNLSNYHSSHGAQNRDRDPGRCAVTAHVADAALCFVLPKNLPSNSSLTSLKQTIFGGYIACPLVNCILLGIHNIPMECVGMSGCVTCIMAHTINCVLCEIFWPALHLLLLT